MKFRTDFVTNSSDSSFLAFNIKNKKLFEALTGLGITFKSVKDGEFSDRMKIVLPSGESDFIDGGENCTRNLTLSSDGGGIKVQWRDIKVTRL